MFERTPKKSNWWKTCSIRSVLYYNFLRIERSFWMEKDCIWWILCWKGRFRKTPGPGSPCQFSRGSSRDLWTFWFMKPWKERKMSRNSALKVIDHALSGKEGIENCEKFVEILGLRTLFPLFMNTPKRNKKSGHTENVSRPKKALIW